jgi:hypothetical protein
MTLENKRLHNRPLGETALENDDEDKLTEVWSCKLSKKNDELCENVIWLLKQGGVLKKSASDSEFMRRALLAYAQQALNMKLTSN